MNRKAILRFGVAVCAFGVWCSVAQASILGGFLSAGQNVLSDESREMFADVGAGNKNSIGVGDVIYGVFRIDTVNTTTSLENQLYLVVSEEIANLSKTILAKDSDGNAVKWRYDYQMKPTTVAAYTLDTLTGVEVDGAKNRAIVAVFDKSTGFTYNVADMTADMTTVTLQIGSEGVFEASYGISDASGSTDYFSGYTRDLTAANDFVNNVALIQVADTTNTLGSYTAGLTLLDNNAPDILDATKFVFNQDDFNWYNAAVSNGTFSGAANVNLANDDDPVSGVYDFKDHTDVTIVAVPEPASLLIWSLSAAAVGLVRTRRRK